MIELIVIVAGLYILISGKIPKFMSTKDRQPGGVVIYKGMTLKPGQARIVGGIYAAVLPIALGGGFIIGIVLAVMGSQPDSGYLISLGCELITLIVAIVVAVQVQNHFYAENQSAAGSGGEPWNATSGPVE